MIWRRGFKLWHIILVALNCLLLLAIVRIWWGGAGAPVAARPGKGPVLPQTPILRDQQPISAFRVVAAKDLFSQNRAGAVEQPAQAQATLEGRQLMGIMVIGPERFALISSNLKSAPKQRTEVDVVRQGEDFEGFRVLEITSEAVVLQGKEGKKTLNFPE